MEVNNKDRKAFEKILDTAGVPFGLAGCLNQGKEFRVIGIDGTVCISAEISLLKEAWQKPLRW